MEHNFVKNGEPVTFQDMKCFLSLSYGPIVPSVQIGNNAVHYKKKMVGDNFYIHREKDDSVSVVGVLSEGLLSKLNRFGVTEVN